MSFPLDELARNAATGSGAVKTRAAARLMTLLERDPQRLPELFQHVPQETWPQPRLVLGITGAPGSGKSSLTDALVAELRRRHAEERIGVIAVDPSSPFTGGAVLGDRVRMMRHATDPNVFIRSLASRGHLGGLSLGVKGVLRVMGLIGCETVVIETVGVGQSEVEVARVADFVVVVLAPGQGDAVQMLKAGLIEAGDLFVVNKADTEGASELYRTLISTLNLVPPSDGANAGPDTAGHRATTHRAHRRDVLLASATDGSGITELVDTLERHVTEEGEQWIAARDASAVDEARSAVLEETRRRIEHAIEREHLERILRGDATVADIARHVLDAAAAAS